MPEDQSPTLSIDFMIAALEERDRARTRMLNEFEQWRKTTDAFKCVQASDFMEVWCTAYQAGLKANA